MNLGWFRSGKKSEKESAATFDDMQLRIDYVTALLNLMLKKSLCDIRLTASEPLPNVMPERQPPPPTPSFQAVSNRLKILCRLNPVCYAEPVQGKIEIARDSHLLVYHVLFEDRAAPPRCSINLKIRSA